MRINKANKEMLNKIDWGDAVYGGYTYDYYNRLIKINCPEDVRKLNFNFNNVVYSELQSCSFWGGGYFINYMGIMEDDSLYKRLCGCTKYCYPNNEMELFEKAADFLPVEIILNSGDTLYILCESMDCT